MPYWVIDTRESYLVVDSPIVLFGLPLYHYFTGGSILGLEKQRRES